LKCYSAPIKSSSKYGGVVDSHATMAIRPSPM